MDKVFEIIEWYIRLALEKSGAYGSDSMNEELAKTFQQAKQYTENLENQMAALTSRMKDLERTVAEQDQVLHQLYFGSR